MKRKRILKKIGIGLILALTFIGSNRVLSHAEEITYSENEVTMGYSLDEFGMNLHFDPYDGASLMSLEEPTWQEIVKQKLTEGAATYQKTVELGYLSDYGYTDENYTELYNLIGDTLLSDSEFFYLKGWKGSISGSYVRITLVYRNDYIKSDGSVDVDAIVNLKAIICETIDNIMLDIDEGMSDLEKALYLHEWIVEQTDYAYEELLNGDVPSYCYSHEGVFVNHKAVCAGYAAAYSVLLESVGIDSYVVSSSELNHAWNLVKIDGKWYHVDCTWDDPVYDKNGGGNGDYWREGSVLHTNFLRTDTGIAETGHYAKHSSAPEDGHKCWSTDNLPEVAEQEIYDNYLYSTVERPLYYHDGYWYYGLDSYIYKSLITENSESGVYTGQQCVNMHVVQGTIYFAAEEALYKISFDNLSNLEQIVDYLGFTAVEFAVKGNNVILNNWNGETKQYAIDEISNWEVTSLELNAPPVKLCYDVGEKLDTKGIVIYAISDKGYKKILEESSLTFDGYDTSKPGKCTVKVIYKGLQTSFEITVSYFLGDSDVTFADNYAYTGQAICPEPQVNHLGKKLVKGTDYTVSYSNNMEIGTATMTVTGIGNYSGTIEKSFTIQPVEVKPEDFTVEFEDPYADFPSYTSLNIIMPSIQVKYKGILLEIGKDYNLTNLRTSISNYYWSTFSFLIEFRGNYSGEYSMLLKSKPIVLNHTTCELKVGDTKQLKVSYENDDTKVLDVWFQTTNRAVAEVDENGLITAVGAGQAVIIVNKGPYQNFCNVTVTESAENSGNTGSGSNTGNNGSAGGDSGTGSNGSTGNSSSTGDSGSTGNNNTGNSSNTGNNHNTETTDNWNYTGLIQDDYGVWWCVSNGQIQYDYTGLWYDANVGWWYVENGSINFGYDGLVEYGGVWWCIAGGRVVFDYTGLWYDPVVGWWYVENGAINFSYDGLVEYGGAWWCIAGGRVVFDYTGLWYDPVVGWWYVQNGTINFSYNGLIPFGEVWWCIAGGRVAFEYTGLWYDPFVGWWYVENGAINFNYNGLIPFGDAWWCIAGGRVAFEYTGLWCDPFVGWWYVQNGIINFSYTGAVSYYDKSYNVINGMILF